MGSLGKSVLSNNSTVPSEGGYVKNISLNSYKGRSIYVKTDPLIYNGDYFNGVIENKIIEWVKDSNSGTITVGW